MKNILRIALLVFIGSTAYGQSGNNVITSAKVKKVRAFDGTETTTNLIRKPNPYVQARNAKSNVETVVGETTYDLQTNSTCQNRIVNHGDGTISLSWTYSNSFDLQASDRGTGYNYFDGTSWGTYPTARQEASTRTGWNSLSRTTQGNEIVVNHPAEPGGALRIMTRTSIGTGTWSEAQISTSLNNDILWPRSVTAGNNGQTVHVIGITAPIANDGTAYNGMDGALLYWRSQDGGSTWDIQDLQVPGSDSTYFLDVDADAYAIDARGNTVAFVMFNQFADVVLFKSTDNGDTWTRTIVNDFPIDKFDIASDLDINNNGVADDSTVTCDGSGAVILDSNDKAHVFYGNFEIFDDSYGDGTFNVLLNSNGISYWNENNAMAAPAVIVEAPDLNNDGVINVEGNSFQTGIGDYVQKSLSTFPSAGIDDDGNIYMCYSAHMENLSNGIQNYRHIFITSSDDGGATWEDPVDANPSFEFQECVFPSMARLVDSSIHIVYQRDEEPGLAVRGDEDAFGTNKIVYMQLQSNLEIDSVVVVDPVGINELTSISELTLSPVPASDILTIQFNGQESGQMNISMYTLLGNKMLENNIDAALGYNHHQIDVSTYESGAYLLRLQLNGEQVVKRIIIQ